MKRLFTFLCVLLLLLSSCKKSENPVEPASPNNTAGNIQTGPSVDLTSQTVGSGGGTIKVTKAGDPLNGLELTIPPNAFTQSENVKISYSSITNHQLGEFFNPISPLIKVQYDGGYADKVVKLKIPINLQAGNFAMAYYYNKNTGELEGIPIDELASDHIIIETRHFMTRRAMSKLGHVNDIFDNDAEIVVASVGENKLNGQTIIDSGFRPGTDDWEFINWGSYVADKGHCAGQSITSMWYYIDKKKKGGALSLFHNFDKVNDATKPNLLWQDNRKGYRFASTIQKDFDWDTWVTDIEVQTSNPDITFKAFALSILQTKEPQFVLIRKSTGKHEGHAMVIYKVDYPNKKLYVADPNFPANRATDGTYSERIIEYKNNKLGPYISGLTAADEGSISFDQIGYFSKTSYVKWEQMAARWVEFDAGIIGQDRFPTYKLFVDKINGDELGDTYSTSKIRIVVLNRSTDCLKFLPGTDRLQRLEVFDEQGNSFGRFNDIPGDVDFGSYTLDLKPGANKLGFYVMGAKDSTSTYFVDFKWITINCNPISMKITPDPLNGKSNTEYTFGLNITGTAPSNAKYVWNFGDNSADVTVQNSTTVKHTFAKEGIFDVKCSMYDNSTNTLIALATSKANILSALLTDILASKSSTVILQADFKSSSSYIGVGNSVTLGNSEAKIRANSKLTWNGLSFSCNYIYKIAPYSGTDSAVVTGNVSGTVSSDGKTISTFSSFERQALKSGTGSWIEQKVEVSNLPFYRTTSVSNQFRNTGPTVASNVTLVSLRKWSLNQYTQQYELVTISSVDYNGTSTVPDLLISMEK